MDSPFTIGIYSPGAMGSALGRAWRSGGARVVTTVDGRSQRTRSLAQGLELLPNLNAVVAVADVVVSVGPPGQARQLAGAIVEAARSTGARPLVADVNAVAPTTLAAIGDELAAAGLGLLDGSISGGPPRPDSSTTLFLSGPQAARLADRPAPGLRCRIVDERLGSASAVKMSTAAVFKGFTALLVQSLATARSHGVTEWVLEELRREYGPQLDEAATLIALAASKSDRFPDEMLEIAETQSEAGLPGSLYRGMAEVYQHLATTELAELTPEQAASVSDLYEVLAATARPRQRP